ncbi:MAG: hypothetical protein GY820_04665 [Gammaproteobacteria bacterium]|nr:hypothetical protein [Gammaproteobacteria bacterium]
MANNANVVGPNGNRIRIVDPATIVGRINLPNVHMTIKGVCTTVTLADNVVNGVNWRCVEWVARHGLIRNETLCQNCFQSMRLVETRQYNDGLQVHVIIIVISIVISSKLPTFSGGA